MNNYNEMLKELVMDARALLDKADGVQNKFNMSVELIKAVVEEAKLEQPVVVQAPVQQVSVVKEEIIEEPKEEPVTVQNSDDVSEVEKWNEIISILKTTSPLIAGVLVDSKAYIKGAYLLIDSKNTQFKTLINSSGGMHKDAIRKAAEKVLGVTYKLGPYTRQAATPEQDPLAALAEKLKHFEVN